MSILLFSLAITYSKTYYDIENKYISVEARIISYKKMLNNNDNLVYYGVYEYEVDNNKYTVTWYDYAHDLSFLEKQITLRYNSDNPALINESVLSILIIFWTLFIMFGFVSYKIITNTIKIYKGELKIKDKISNKSKISMLKKIESYLNNNKEFIQAIFMSFFSFLSTIISGYVVITMVVHDMPIISGKYERVIGTVISFEEVLEEGEPVYFPIYEYEINGNVYTIKSGVSYDNKTMLYDKKEINYNKDDYTEVYIELKMNHFITYIIFVTVSFLTLLVFTNQVNKIINYKEKINN